MLQLAIAKIIFTVLLPREFGLAVLLLCVLVQTLRKKWAPGNPSAPFSMIPVLGQSGDTGGSTGWEGCVSFSRAITNLSHCCCHGALLSACIALLEQGGQCSLHVEWSELRIFHFTRGKGNCLLC